MDRVVGVMKAYTTRVGEGPLPTEDAGISDLLHGIGREFGATTGRARRCGWFDAVVTRHAAMVNGIDELAITNIDGLDTLATIKVCVGYRLNGDVLRYVPADIEHLARCSRCTRSSRAGRPPPTSQDRWEDLPVNSPRITSSAIAQLTGARLTIASVGPAREQTIPVCVGCPGSATAPAHEQLPAPRPAPTCPSMWPSSWMATAAGPRSAACPAIEGHRKAPSPSAPSSGPPGELGIRYLTLYAFSVENWNRPKDEVDTLMKYLARYLKNEIGELDRNNVRLEAIGQIWRLPEAVQEQLRKTKAALAKNNGLTLVLCLSYGGRTELVDAVREIAAKAKAGRIDPAEINEHVFAEHLYTRHPGRIRIC